MFKNVPYLLSLNKKKKKLKCRVFAFKVHDTDPGRIMFLQSILIIETYLTEFKTINIWVSCL